MSDTYKHNPDYYCPNCGQQGSLWTADDGDYYAGCMSICGSCGKRCYLDDCGDDAPPEELQEVRVSKEKL